MKQKAVSKTPRGRAESVAYQDTGTNAVQNTNRQQRCLAVRGEVFVHADTDSDSDGRDQGECQTHDPGGPFTGKVEQSDSCA